MAQGAKHCTWYCKEQAAPMHCTWNVSGMEQKCFCIQTKILWIMPPFPPHKGKIVYNWLFAGSHTVLKTHNRHKLQPQQPRLKPPHCRRKQAAEKMVAGTMEAQSFVGSHVPGYAVLFPLQKNCPLWACVLFFQNLEGQCPSNIGMRQFLHDLINTFCLPHFKLCTHQKTSHDYPHGRKTCLSPTVGLEPTTTRLRALRSAG